MRDSLTNPQITQDPSPRTTLTLSGTVTWETAAREQVRLLEALVGTVSAPRRHPSVILDLDKLFQIDPACLQLLFAVRRTAQEAGFRLQIRHPGPPDPVRQVAREAGFQEQDEAWLGMPLTVPGKDCA